MARLLVPHPLPALNEGGHHVDLVLQELFPVIAVDVALLAVVVLRGLDFVVSHLLSAVEAILAVRICAGNAPLSSRRVFGGVRHLDRRCCGLWWVELRSSAVNGKSRWVGCRSCLVSCVGSMRVHVEVKLLGGLLQRAQTRGSRD